MRTAGDVSSLTARGEDLTGPARDSVASVAFLLFAIFTFIAVPLGPSQAYAAAGLVSEDRQRKFIPGNLPARLSTPAEERAQVTQSAWEAQLLTAAGDDVVPNRLQALAVDQPTAAPQLAADGAAFVLEFVASTHAPRGPPRT